VFTTALTLEERIARAQTQLAKPASVKPLSSSVVLAPRRIFPLAELSFSKFILNLPLAVMSCQGFDDKVEVATEFRALARRADVASPRRPSRNLWRYRRSHSVSDLFLQRTR
jgi:hypothetical protein